MNFLYRFRFLLFVCCLSLLLWGILRSELPPKLFEDSDKLLHLLAFMGLGLTARFAFNQLNGWWLWSVLLISAPSLEVLQHWLQPQRFFSGFDALFNMIGVLLALVVWKLLMGKASHSRGVKAKEL
ncbi:MAG: hypothetical protein ISEC1_P2078 [Thiomicrorhabdus sp.]|nr:MAG: hypothetical protein ISEC1_P0773 [Thiomicrorhabdus sp.]GKT13080.1 MAG: hypothetical protein ISEC1_P2078 [Thiomicrorhabdus sp.]